MKRSIPLLALSLLCASCAPAQSNAELEAMAAKVPELEARVTELEAVIDRVKMAVNLPASPEREEEANKMAVDAQKALEAMDMEVGRKLVNALVADYGDTTMGRAAQQIATQLEVIGADAGTLDVEWMNGTEGSFEGSKATLLVFFEEWCPHCQREVPNMQATFTRMQPDGLNVVGISNYSRGTTKEQMDEFLNKAEVSFAVGKEDGALSTRYKVDGVPYAVLVKDGKVAWSGHPGNMTEDKLKKFLN
ncbi:MAG: peroxiredoxin [Kiritimatiellia bacterium]|jgi:peroxiredoxin